MFLVSVFSVSALSTRLNVSITETVEQNVSFADQFTLTETTDFCTITGLLNVSNPSNDTVGDIYLSFSNTDNMFGNFTYEGGRNGSQSSGSSPGDVYIIHVPELLSTEFSYFNYTLNCSSVNPPLDIDTSYSNAETGINRKVLAGHNWTITQTATNNLSIGVPINNINITIQAQAVTWNASSENFTLVNLSETGDYANVVGNGTSNHTWYWAPNGGTLASLASQNISYLVGAPDNVPTSGTYMAIRETLTYRIFYLSSNLSLDNITAIADVDFDLQKRITQPADNINNTNVTWRVDSSVTAPINVSYNLTQVSIWVTATLDPTNYTTPFGRLNTTFTPNSEVNLSSSWSSTAWYFNYTDASNNVSSRPPIVWMRPYFTIINGYNQIINSTITQNGNDLYMKYIYVINGYWLQIDKNITNIGADQYRIDTIVQNVGNAWTPEGLVVTAYDFVPVEFTAFNFSEGYDALSSVTGDGFNGTSYRWTIPGKDPYNASLGPASESYLNRTWNVTYFVNGSGDYKVSELYIVGLDPRKVDGAGASELINIVGAFNRSPQTEMFYVFIVLFLVIINVVNFVMTRRINKKLNDHHK